MNSNILRATAVLFAAIMTGAVACGSGGCGGTNINSSNLSAPISMSCGRGTYLSGNQCVAVPPSSSGSNTNTPTRTPITH
jgi:hypothetical protein